MRLVRIGWTVHTTEASELAESADYDCFLCMSPHGLCVRVWFVFVWLWFARFFVSRFLCSFWMASWMIWSSLTLNLCVMLARLCLFASLCVLFSAFCFAFFVSFLSFRAGDWDISIFLCKFGIDVLECITFIRRDIFDQSIVGRNSSFGELWRLCVVAKKWVKERRLFNSFSI